MLGVMHTCHVLILTPFIVLCINTSRTVMLETQAFVLSFPRLPMLIPCPGPQLILCIYTFEQPVCIEIQSSPVCKIKPSSQFSSNICLMHKCHCQEFVFSWEA